jgi:hypothetical protein
VWKEMKFGKVGKNRNCSRPFDWSKKYT